MSLLKHQQNVSPWRGMPVDDKGSASSITTVTGETVQLYYNNAGVLTADAGQLAGVVVVGQLAYDNVKCILGNMEAIKGDTSLSFTSNALTTEVAFDFTQFESLDEGSVFNKMTTIGALLSNGQYAVDYGSGTIYGKKTDTGTTLTSTTYKYKSSATSSSGGGTAVTSVIPGTAATNLGKAEDAVHASGDVGVMTLGVRTDTPAAIAGTTGDYTPAIFDSLNHQWMREGYAAGAEDNTNGVFAFQVKPLAVSTYSPSQFSNLGANTTLNIKATTGNIFSLYAYQTNAAARFEQIHNTATVPSGGAVPILSFLVGPSSDKLIGTEFFTQAGWNASLGLAFAHSTTFGTYTAGTAADGNRFISYK